MPSIQFRATIFDSDGSTPLAPRSGSVHSESFRVTTERGVSGWRPVLLRPRGRDLVIDPLTRAFHSGQLALSIVDERVGTLQSERWGTAFLGDALGRDRYKSKKIVVERSIDGVWADWYAGIVDNVETRDTPREGAYLDFQLIESPVHEKRSIFVGLPHASVASYAKPANLWPVGLLPLFTGTYGPRPWNNAPPRFRAPMNGEFPRATVVVKDGAEVVFKVHDESVRRLDHAGRLTTALAQSADARDTSVAPARCLDARVWIRKSGGASGHMRLRVLTDDAGAVPGEPYDGLGGPISIDHLYRVRGFAAVELPATDPNYIAAPASSEAVECYLFHAGAPFKNAPLLIDPVHPAQFWKDINLGYFGPLDATGAPTLDPIPMLTSEFDHFIAEEYEPIRLVIENAWDNRPFVEKHISQSSHFTGHLDGSGRVVPVDLAHPRAGLSSPRYDGTQGAVDSVFETVDREDYISAKWKKGAEIVTLIRAELLHYDEWDSIRTSPQPGVLDLRAAPESLVDTFAFDGPGKITNVFPSEFAGNLPLRDLTLTIAGVRPKLWTDWDLDQPIIGHYASGYRIPAWIIEPYLERFGTGAMFLEMEAKVNATTKDIRPGMWRIVEVDHAPNPASNKLGGKRFMVCVSQRDSGDRVKLRWLDAGPNSVAPVPAITSWGTTPGATDRACRLVLALASGLDASGNPFKYRAVADFIVTENSVMVRPADDDPRWQRWRSFTADGTYDLTGMQVSDRKVWLRVQSAPDTGAILKSAFVYPAAPAQPDPLAAPSALGEQNISATTAELVWTLSGSAVGVVVYMVEGSSPPAAWSLEHALGSFGPIERHELRGLKVDQAYTWSVATIGQYGGVSQPATPRTFSTLSSTPTTPRPAGISLATFANEIA